MKALEKFAMIKVARAFSAPKSTPFLRQEAGLGSKLIGGGVLGGIGMTSVNAAG